MSSRAERPLKGKVGREFPIEMWLRLAAFRQLRVSCAEFYEYLHHSLGFFLRVSLKFK